MKISNCPECGQQPVVSPGDGPMNSIWCMGPDDAFHSRVGTGCYYRMKIAAVEWERIVKAYNRKCVNGNCSIKATCGRYHQAANIFEAQGADGLYDRHSCRKGKCDHHVAKEVTP